MTSATAVRGRCTLPDAFDLSAPKPARFSTKSRVAAVDVHDVVHLGSTPSATKPASTSPAPARMSDDHTGALDSCWTPRSDRVMAVGPGVGAEPDHLLDEPEPGLEDVLGDHRRAVGDRGERRSPSAAGRSGSPGRAASTKSTAVGPVVLHARGSRRRLGVDLRAGVAQLVQHQLQVVRVDARAP